MMSEENDYITLGHDYEDISRVYQCSKWLCIGFVAICIVVVIVVVLV
jgi:hypothetical protein